MDPTLEFPDLLRLIDERSTAFRSAIAAAASLDVHVPTCPEWTLSDLAQHLGVGRRAWTATIAAGPQATATAEGPPAPVEREALLAWLAASTQELLDALTEAGPDRGCWTWWGSESQSSQTCAAVARHQLQEVAVHTYDAQLTVGTAQPLPDEVALDGVEDFLFTCCSTTTAWPHKPATVDYHATEGRSWRQRLSADGSRIDHLLPPGPVAGEDPADTSVQGPASQLVLWFYGRVPLDSLQLDGDPELVDQLNAWDLS